MLVRISEAHHALLRRLELGSYRERCLKILQGLGPLSETFISFSSFAQHQGIAGLEDQGLAEIGHGVLILCVLKIQLSKCDRGLQILPAKAPWKSRTPQSVRREMGDYHASSGTLRHWPGFSDGRYMLHAGGLRYRVSESSVPVDDLVNDRQRLELLTRQATACIRKRRPARAVALLTEIIRQMPTNAAAYLNRGSAQATAGEVALAISDYTAAINLQPDLFEAWYDRGTTFMHVRRYENATADLTEAIRLKPDFALAYCNRGLAKFQLGDYDQALADYSTGIEHDDAVNYCYLNRGTLYLTLGEYQKAIDDLTRAIGDKPSDAIVLSRRGQAHEALGQSSRALDDFRAALEANPRLQSAEEGFARITAQQTRSDGDSRGSK